MSSPGEDRAEDADGGATATLSEPDPLTSLGFIPQRDQAFVDDGGITRRLICREDVYTGEELLQTVWLIEFGEGAEKALPEPRPFGEFLGDLQSRRWRLADPPQDERTEEQLTPSQAQRAAAERVWDILHKAVDVDDRGLEWRIVDDKRLLHVQGRKLLLLRYEQKLKVTWKTLLNWLRTYWQSGRRKSAFIPNFQNRGLGRPDSPHRAPGRKIDAGTASEATPYYIPDHEMDWIWRFTWRLLRKKSRKAKDVYHIILKRKYTYLDADGKIRLNTSGTSSGCRQLLGEPGLGRALSALTSSCLCTTASPSVRFPGRG